jgi:hypothetical protein
MAPDAPTPLPLRPTTADRERVARELREGSVDGRISIDTFSERVARVFSAGSRDELDALAADLHRPGRFRRLLMHFFERPRLPVLGLPASEREVVLGRSRECDCVIAEASVSRRHAGLRRDGTRWVLRDLGSRNGTRVNGVRLLDEAQVAPGDRVSFGDARYRLGEVPRPSTR